MQPNAINYSMWDLPGVFKPICGFSQYNKTLKHFKLPMKSLTRFSISHNTLCVMDLAMITASIVSIFSIGSANKIKI